ncbi:ribonuclease J [Caldanaerobius fijiensis DSM 17918]|uniref:Ribonuclease J n=1 Tax=Caldanaerobius fijiensis DSM 17918 TaxID=1121256 RepID=A0A1M4U276_9THEO|nr:ribonuclease J [Caldanaerobius fijiensis]SHE50696.1 ribonuclease J [Caldanaerobius fijiensis DSM 17918]
MPAKNSKIRIIPLGGLNEIGKNMTVYEYKDEIIVVDCGLAFPDDEMLGIDLVIPDISYLLKNQEKVKAIILTHGHEDHIGALPYVLKQINVPVYGTRLTMGIVETRLKEQGLLRDSKLINVNPGESVEIGNFKVEFIRTTHSIADSVALAIHTPMGVIVHTSDFKVDYTPIDGKPMDIHRFAELGKKGVLVMLADSTNIERPGYTLSEKTVGEALDNIFSGAEGRILIATFASNIHRIQQVINATYKYNRKLAVSGRSMINVINVAVELGYLNLPSDMMVSLEDAIKLPHNKVVILTTGSQGEPMSALTRMAYSEHKLVDIVPGDLVIISADPIPGNEKTVSRVINQLFKKGAEVVYEALADVHVSGHACQEELKLMHTLVKPKFFIPVHGEYRHLKQHAKLAENLGMPPENIFIADNGYVLEFNRDSGRIAGTVTAGRVLVDGFGVGDVGNIVLRDRKHLSQDGLLVVVVTISKDSGSVIAGPDIISRGFVYVRESEDLMEEIKKVVKKSLDECLSNNFTEWATIKSEIKNAVTKFLFEKTARKPMILPIIMEI